MIVKGKVEEVDIIKEEDIIKPSTNIIGRIRIDVSVENGDTQRLTVLPLKKYKFDDDKSTNTNYSRASVKVLQRM